MKANEFIIKKEFVDPADDPNAGFDKEFKQDSMFNQLGKILDSQGNPRPLDTVVTDDGQKHKVSFGHARKLRQLLTAPRVKPDVKRQFTKDLQTSEVLSKFLQAKTGDEMVDIFTSMYKIDQAEPTNYGD